MFDSHKWEMPFFVSFWRRKRREGHATKSRAHFVIQKKNLDACVDTEVSCSSLHHGGCDEIRVSWWCKAAPPPSTACALALAQTAQITTMIDDRWAPFASDDDTTVRPNFFSIDDM
jgi:hypothetical protein